MTKRRKSETHVARPHAIPEKKRKRFAFVIETWSELRKTIWPTRKEVVRHTILVLGMCAVVGLFLGGVDLGFYRLVNDVFR